VARERGIDLEVVVGSGPGGRIVRADVDRVTAAEDTEVTPRCGLRHGAESCSDDDIEALSSMRLIVARRMSESVREAPHFYATVTFAAEQLLALRAHPAHDGGGSGRVCRPKRQTT